MIVILAEFAYIDLWDVENYLQKLLAVLSIQDDSTTYLPQLKNLLGNHAYAVSEMN